MIVTCPTLEQYAFVRSNDYSRANTSPVSALLNGMIFHFTINLSPTIVAYLFLTLRNAECPVFYFEGYSEACETRGQIYMKHPASLYKA